MRVLRERASVLFSSRISKSIRSSVRRGKRCPSIAVRRRRVRSNTRVISSLRMHRPVRLRIPPRVGSGNHACDARRSAHLPDAVTFEAQPSEYIQCCNPIRRCTDFQFAEIETDFEFLVNSNSYLRVTRDPIKLVGAVHQTGRAIRSIAPTKLALFARRWAVLVRACDRRLAWQRGLAAMRLM